MSAKAKLQSKIDSQTTEQLFTLLKTLEGQMEGYGEPEERMVRALITDTVTDRHDLDDALDAIFMESPDYSGTYTQALETAYLTATS